MTEARVEADVEKEAIKTEFKKQVFIPGLRIRIQDPDPLVRGMDPRIRIRIHPKMSWIRDTAWRAVDARNGDVEAQKMQKGVTL